MTETAEETQAGPHVDWIPGPGGKDDPRLIGLVRCGDIVIDQRAQRSTDPAKVQWLADHWDWTLGEVPTLSRREGGMLVATEGQHRVLSSQARDPDIRMWCVLAEDISGIEDEAATALGIARGRRQHSRVQEWRMRVTSNMEHEVMAEKVLQELNLTVGEVRTSRQLTSAATLMKLIHGTESRPRTPAQGADILRRTLSAIQVIPEDPTKAGSRYDSAMIMAVGALISQYPALDVQRLAEKLQAHTATQWMAYKRSATPQWRGIYNVLKADYNKSTRQRRLT